MWPTSKWIWVNCVLSPRYMARGMQFSASFFFLLRLDGFALLHSQAVLTRQHRKTREGRKKERNWTCIKNRESFTSILPNIQVVCSCTAGSWKPARSLKDSRSWRYGSDGNFEAGSARCVVVQRDTPVLGQKCTALTSYTWKRTKTTDFKAEFL